MTHDKDHAGSRLITIRNKPPRLPTETIHAYIPTTATSVISSSITTALTSSIKPHKY